MDVQQKLDEIVATVDSARSMPMSASCVVNRAELLAMLSEVREALPGSLAQAQEVLGGREQVVAEAQQEARRIIEAAEAQRDALVAETEVVRRSQAEAERILGEARRESEAIRAEADDYVDSKLANFEVVLTKTIGSVDRGREKLLGRAPGAAPEEYDDAPERSSDPRELRDRADAYVEAQFRAFETVLTKTLEAVGRGRQKLLGHRPIDELAAHLAAQDGTPGEEPRPQADDDYLAGLADTTGHSAPSQPVAAGYATDVGHQGGYPHQDPHGYPPSYPPPQPEPAAPGYAPSGYPSADGYPAPDGYAPVAGGHPGEGYPTPEGQPVSAGYPGTVDGQPDGYPVAAQADPTLGGVPEHGYGQTPYGQDGGYAWQPQPGTAPTAGYDPAGGYPPPPPQQPGALDETSLFDTSVIDVDQLRQYERGT